jgi:pyruvate/2-oxoglutarate dehydrogenase complex dihydrolipoamide dehydrogenase (E3) component
MLVNAGIETDGKGFIKVNERLETNVEGIYALGDVKGGPAFTHISYDDYRIILANLIRNENRTVNDRLIPYTMFTDPELGRVGITEQEAIQLGMNYKAAVMPFSYVARAVESGETRGLMKAVVDADTGMILGCSILGVHGGELMSMISIAMSCKMPYEKIRDAIFAHPTFAESLNNLFSKLKPT